MEYNPGNPYEGGSRSVNQQREFTWLDYTILKNPNGVMAVLSKYGYIGYLAPQSNNELIEVSQLLIQKYEDKAIIDLLRVHPDYEVIKGTPVEGYQVENEVSNNFSNFTENKAPTEIRKINFEKGLLIIGGLLLAATLIK